jgi:hypothetical protein
MKWSVRTTIEAHFLGTGNEAQANFPQLDNWGCSMNFKKLPAILVWKRLLIATAVVVAAIVLYRHVRAEIHQNSVIGVGLTGFQHIGPNFNIPEFYFDGYYGSNVGREGGGGGEMCCVVIPKKWRPGLVVDLRWAVADWSNVDPAAIDGQAYKSLTYQFFRATVPVEKYQSAENIFVHFYPGGKARVVSGLAGLGTPEHPVSNDDPDAVGYATVGQPTNAIFSKEEMDEMDRKHNERSTFFGDWR